MTNKEDQIKKSNKKFAVGELPPSPTTSTGLPKRTRHHVKRRSSGRVHVSKLAPMAKHNEEEKPMKRTQSNKSLTKLSSMKGFGITTDIPNSPPQTPSISLEPFSLDQDPIGSLHQATLLDDLPKSSQYTQELEGLSSDYHSIRQFRDPMMESLARCQGTTVTQPPLTFSTKDRKQKLLMIASQQQEEVENKWSATLFIERLFFT